MKTLFKIKSDRTQDVKLDDGATVRKLRDYCAAKGYDVMNARICVIRVGRPRLYGSNTLDYVLQDGDAVCFDTTCIDMPNLRSEINGALDKASNNAATPCGELSVDVKRNPDGSVTINIQ